MYLLHGTSFNFGSIQQAYFSIQQAYFKAFSNYTCYPIYYMVSLMYINTSSSTTLHPELLVSFTDKFIDEVMI